MSTIQIETVTLQDGSKIDVIRDVEAVKNALAAAQEDKALLDEFDRLRKDVVEGRQISEDECEAELVGCYWETPMVQSMSCRDAIRAAIGAARKEDRT